ncbi:MAG: DUF1549 domain-containing protein [Bryobacterales bacterium]|nr:DUF1549 domain-containing protein [Bryobacterales bacterium]
MNVSLHTFAAGMFAVTGAFGAAVDYARDVHTILAARCFACHSGDKRSGGLSLSSYDDVLRGGRNGAALVPGASAESLMVSRLTAKTAERMPPVGEPLNETEITLLREWIDQGARPRPDGPVAKRRWVPKLALDAPPAPPDRALGAYFKRHRIPPSAVSDIQFARRAYFDIWGLPPTPEQLREFAASPRPDKRERLVNTLLANWRNYAEHWISFWNDLLRNDEGVNYHGGRQSITPWLLRALEDNMPYNEFVSRLLNPRNARDPEGFLMGVNWRGDVNASQTPVMQAAQNTAQIFAGVNLKCNSCHDSFISRWKLKDAYGLASFFSEEKLELVRCDAKLGQIAEIKFLYPELGDGGAGETLASRRVAAAKLFTAPENGRFARTIVNRMWKKLTGRGIVEPVDDMDAEPWSPDLLDGLSADFVEHGYDLKWLIARIMTSRAYGMESVDAVRDEKEYVFRGPMRRRITAEQFSDTISAITGEWRVLTSSQGKAGIFARDWRRAATPLARAMGRPIRDQVFTERNGESTTLQALEMTNGGSITQFLRRASKRMLGELPEAPANLFDSGKVSSNRVTVDIDVSGLKELRLLVVDMGSYSPERVLPVWADAEFEGPAGVTKLGGEPVAMKDKTFERGLRARAQEEIVHRIGGKGYTRFRAVVGVEAASIQSDIGPDVRFFVFSGKPDFERLVRVEPETPTGAPKGPFEGDALVSRVYSHALGREPQAAERRLARELLANEGGLADLIWCVTMLPEFQLIY